MIVDPLTPCYDYEPGPREKREGTISNFCLKCGQPGGYHEGWVRSLDQIGLMTETDRASSFHDYCRTYGELFVQLRYTRVRLLEMGVLGGGGLEMWSRYFTHPETRIVGLDIEPWRCRKIDDSRVRVVAGSQTDEQIKWEEPFDLIFDDAGHFASAQIIAFNYYFPNWLNPGGLYFIEDLHSYAAPELSNGPENIMQYLTRIATEMQGRGAKASGKVEPGDVWASIDTITFRKGLAIIRKA